MTMLLYGGTIFLSAFLLFGVQPMFTRMVLPILGGSPAVWSIAMVFFQALLLAGYGYAHLLVSRLRPAIAVGIHVTVTAIAFLTLPLTVRTFGAGEPSGPEALWLLGVFAASVGLPFFALSANGPLLQAWFSRLGTRGSQDPYFLYAASNAGSFLALIAYPLIVEPWLRLSQQSVYWAIAYGVLGAAVATCGTTLLVRRANPASPVRAQAAEQPAPKLITWRDRLNWMWLAFIPSGLLVAVTAHITTDVASAPLLWVAPLAFFLLTFILTFRDRPLIPLEKIGAIQVWATGLIFIVMIRQSEVIWMVAVHLGLFLVNGIICHRALYMSRPRADQLTSFYLWMSAGGVLGGAFSGLLAPNLFSTVLEYPALLIAALSVGRDMTFRRLISREAVPGLAAAAVVGVSALMMIFTDLSRAGYFVIAALIVIATMMIMWRRPIAVITVGAVCAFTISVFSDMIKNTESYRSFFGVNKVFDAFDGQYRYLSHRSTIHGAIRVRTADGQAVAGRPEPLTYYTAEGSNVLALEAIRLAQGGRLDNVAAVGLGSGSIACSSRAGESWTFFEIDALVIKIATDPTLFRFLSACTPDVRIVQGDARLTLRREAQPFNAIFLDAFSSDAIPAHLVTVEALKSYTDRLTSEGALIFHISNRHLDLRAIIARAAAEVGLVAYETVTAPSIEGSAPSMTVVMGRSDKDLGAIAIDRTWRKIVPDMTRTPWTDDYSNILEGIKDRYYGVPMKDEAEERRMPVLTN